MRVPGTRNASSSQRFMERIKIELRHRGIRHDGHFAAHTGLPEQLARPLQESRANMNGIRAIAEIDSQGLHDFNS